MVHKFCWTGDPSNLWMVSNAPHPYRHPEAFLARVRSLIAHLHFSGRVQYMTIGSHIGGGTMKELQLKDAKATLSAVVDQAVAGEPTVITATAARRRSGKASSRSAVLTANERHFAPLGVPHDNPLKRLPDGR
jgi:hypothetical protein